MLVRMVFLLVDNLSILRGIPFASMVWANPKSPHGGLQ